MEVAQIIDAFGGYRALADDLGCGRTTVFMWQTTGIPAARALELADLAKARGLKRISLKVLMEAKPRTKDQVAIRKPRMRAATGPLDGKRP
jgi:hypothetical protein